MKKLITLALLIVAMGIAVTAQIATYSVAKTQVTIDGTWEDFEVEDKTDQSILVVYDFEAEKIKLTNLDQSIFFIREGEMAEPYTDEDGDVLNTLSLSCWDEEAKACLVVFKWWEDTQFEGGIEALMTVYNDDYWVRYYLMIEGYRNN